MSDILVDLVNKVITLRKQFPQVIVLETGIVRRSLTFKVPLIQSIL